jgi:carotenoid cleavage dioxygenase
VPFFSKTVEEDPLGPDELDPGAVLWPDHEVVPFHNLHPVTGKPVVPGGQAT